MSITNIHIIITIISILFVAFFAGIEIAFISANKLNVELKKKQGAKAGEIIGRFMAHPEDFIGTSLVGINIFLVIYEHFMSSITEKYLEHLPAPLNSPDGKMIIDAIIGTVIILILGEFLPKAFFRSKAEQILYFFSKPITFFYNLLYPIAKLFVRISEWILKYIFNIKVNEHKQVFNRVDLEQFVKQMNTGHQDETSEVNTELFENALYLRNVKIRECLVPRKEIECIDINDPMEDLKKLFIDTKLSKIIVTEGSIDNVKGYVHHLDMLRNPKSIKDILHKIEVVPESMNAVDVMNKFTKNSKSIAWVIDEYGGTAGITTMEDVLEEIFGEINDEHDVEQHVEQQIAENEFIFSGRLELDYLNQKYGFDFSDEEADTLNGYIVANNETIPKKKDKVIIQQYEFDILSVTETQVSTVKLRWLKENES